MKYMLYSCWPLNGTFYLIAVSPNALTLVEGSFSENFYGLKRVSHPQSLLTKSQWYGSLFFLVGWPYIQSKVDHGYAQWKERMNRPGHGLSKWKVWFVQWFPYFKSGQWAILFGYQLAYLLNRSPYFTPWLHLLGISIQRLTLEDIVMLTLF
jgi:peroxin-12